MRRPITRTASTLHRLFASDKNTRLARQLVMLLLGVVLMIILMSVLTNVARAVRPVSLLASFIEHQIERLTPQSPH